MSKGPGWQALDDAWERDIKPRTEKWEKIFGLESWDITYRLMDTLGDASGNATISSTFGKMASINFAYGLALCDDPAWIENAVAHELLHVLWEPPWAFIDHKSRQGEAITEADRTYLIKLIEQSHSLTADVLARQQLRIEELDAQVEEARREARKWHGIANATE